MAGIRPGMAGGAPMNPGNNVRPVMNMPSNFTGAPAPSGAVPPGQQGPLPSTGGPSFNPFSGGFGGLLSGLTGGTAAGTGRPTPGPMNGRPMVGTGQSPGALPGVSTLAGGTNPVAGQPGNMAGASQMSAPPQSSWQPYSNQLNQYYGMNLGDQNAAQNNLVNYANQGTATPQQAALAGYNPAAFQGGGGNLSGGNGAWNYGNVSQMVGGLMPGDPGYAQLYQQQMALQGLGSVNPGQ